MIIFIIIFFGRGVFALRIDSSTLNRDHRRKEERVSYVQYSSNSLKVKKHLNSQQAGNTRNSEIGFSDFNIYYQSSRKKIELTNTKMGTTTLLYIIYYYFII